MTDWKEKKKKKKHYIAILATVPIEQTKLTL